MMMMMKTAELPSAALEYAVALAEGYKFGQPVHCDYGVVFPVSIPGQKTLSQAHLSTDKVWACNVPDYLTGLAGDNIIDREKIDVIWVDNEGSEFGADSHWNASLSNPLADQWGSNGATRREAAMRAYVASKLGDEVEIPKELQDGQRPA